MTQYGSVSALGAESHVFKSHYFESFIKYFRMIHYCGIFLYFNDFNKIEE